MPRMRLLWQLYPTYLLITMVALLAVGWYTSHTLRQFYHEQVAHDLEVRAHLVAQQIARRFTPVDRTFLDSLCKGLHKSTSTRVTLILPDGRVLGDSDADPASMENHADRPEVIKALAGRIGTATRYSHTLQQNMMYLAFPLRERGRVMGIVRTALPLTGIDRPLRSIQWRILLEGLAVAIVAALISLIVSRRISRPLEEMKRGAERFAGGDLDGKLPVPDSEELGSLAEAMNQMATQLDERIRTIMYQRNEQEVIMARLQQLETMRRDFVANVSHELKTPITAIKGFVETLLQGALRHPEDAERFLGIIARQADRLDAILEDLLSLARIEQEADNGPIKLDSAKVKDILQVAIQDCDALSLERNIKILLNCEDDISCRINSPLFEQAIANLLDNAIKYSPSGSLVKVEVNRTNTETIVSVRDPGCGIAKEHLPRLFERFYRVDKARSRKLGGTGLGLAIVKHIALAHGGGVSVESSPGLGSTFRFHIPLLS